ncbi:MAG: hypothetical protein JWN77_1593 [Frankiales bacterium]|nr:hypothetical protein [Frankiales bacterium]
MKGALLLVAATALLGLYMVVRAVDLFRTGTVFGVLLGVGVLLLVLVGGLLVAGEVRLGAGSARLAARLETEGDQPDPDLERTASGRLTSEAAGRLFALRKGEVEAAPEDWRAWWRLGAAYGEARDTSAGRRAMRKAIALEKAER